MYEDNQEESKRVQDYFAKDLLREKVCVITGGGTGLGRATAIAFGELGAHVVVCGRRPEPIESTVDMIRTAGGSAWSSTLDIRDDNSVDDFIDQVLQKFGPIDVLVNNAGGQFHSPAENITSKGYRTVIDLNVMGTWNMTRSVAVKSMIPGGGGRILNVTLSPHNGVPLMVHAAASRAAVESMTKTLSIEWARHGITVCALAAGTMKTDTLYTKYPSAVGPMIDNVQPLGRPGTETEWASFLAFMASNAADFFTGCVLTMDGGRDNYPSVFPPPGMPPEMLEAFR
ncbi:SDR family NAD(P)-dependent oxidoreductase [Nocardia sp. NPDC004604]|uniref:SDR family NAD(P)-dependent oxidoreductase n=1 Tax=Nocardia sp. NPDC004604 TaxID=3157013 RepID=UPI0033AE92FB